MMDDFSTVYVVVGRSLGLSPLGVLWCPVVVSCGGVVWWCRVVVCPVVSCGVSWVGGLDYV